MRHIFLPALSAALLALTPMARAEITPPVSDLVTAELLPGWDTADGTRMAGLRLRLAPGWKTYWRAPGDAGIPPQFDFSGSENLRGARLHWPSPDVFMQGDMLSIGYHDEVTIPVELTPAHAGAPMRLEASVAMGVCKDICVPVTLRFSSALPQAGKGREPSIVSALLDAPMTPKAAGLTGVRCAVAPVADGLRVEASLDMPPLGPDEVAVFELPGSDLWISQAESDRQGGRLTAASEFVPSNGGPVMLDRSRIRITVLADGRAVEINGCPGG